MHDSNTVTPTGGHIGQTEVTNVLDCLHNHISYGILAIDWPTGIPEMNGT